MIDMAVRHDALLVNPVRQTSLVRRASGKPQVRDMGVNSRPWPAALARPDIDLYR